jgi:hypothetical protein
MWHYGGWGRRMYTGFRWGNAKEKGYLEGLGIVGRIILKFIT